MDNPQKQQTAERIKQANNILITVSNNPTVDQLSACIGLTLALNKLSKHATAVFSGAIPNTIEFLQPEKTIEKTTDSLRDFIIALDKAKADKLRYKVEDKVVKIFITPYRTSISNKDLQFSQGDFNVDVVLALGVHNQRELDQAITSHGRILHDAAVITMNVKPGGDLGAVNWLDTRASSLSELAVQLIDAIDKKMLDSQIATALLTGIVAETQRFRNDKTSPLTMSYSAELMTAGANQQLVATKLEEKPKAPPPPPPAAVQPTPVAAASQAPAPAPAPKKPSTEGVLEIEHEKPLALQDIGEEQQVTPQIDIDQEGQLRQVAEQAQAARTQPTGVQAQPTAPAQAAPAEPAVLPTPSAIPSSSPAQESVSSQNEPVLPELSSSTDPTKHMGGASHKILPPSANTMTPGAYGEEGGDEGTINPLSAPSTAPTSNTPLLSRQGEAPSGQPSQTLSQIEQSVGSPHIAGQASGAPDLSSIRNAVDQAENEQAVNQPQQPISGLGAQPLGGGLHEQQPQQGGVLPPPSVPPPMMPPSQ